MKHIGIFLDRDGTVNEEVDFLSSPDKLSLIPRSADAIRQANELGIKVFIVTNQSGIARGLLTEQQLAIIHQTLTERLQHENAFIDAIYYCPHHPEIGKPPYRMHCDCRKPNIGMLTRAATEFSVDLNESFVVGDRMIDIQTARAAGSTGILVLTGYGKNELRLCETNHLAIDYVAENLFDAVRYIKQKVRAKKTSVS